MHLLPIALTVKNFNKSTAATIQLGSYNMPPRIWGGVEDEVEAGKRDGDR